MNILKLHLRITIETLLRGGASQREIERHTGVDRKTIRRVAGGGLKARECREFLEALEAQGVLRLPAKRATKPVGSTTRVPVSVRGEPAALLEGKVGAFEPIVLEPVRSPEQRLLFRELVGRYHYLGQAVPFGAHLRYLFYSGCTDLSISLVQANCGRCSNIE